MPKSGSAWYYLMTNDLLVAAGHDDARVIRDRYRLNVVLKSEVCRWNGPRLRKLLVLLPHLAGRTFAIKMHGRPYSLVQLLVGIGAAKATYIYRDPRDAALSAYNHGQRRRLKGQGGTFAQLQTVESAIDWASKRAAAWDKWRQYGRALMVRYEDLTADTVGELQRLAEFLQVDVPIETLESIAQRYQSQNIQRGGVLHFHRGVVGRFRQEMSPEQITMCQVRLRDQAVRMGYE
jgi:hypothetical protein